MPRIYFDSNIYRYLKKDPDARLLDVQEYIKENDQIHVFFSSAHLFDLGRDKTDHKFNDLTFMEQLTGQNYIHLDQKDEFVITTLATPTEAFGSIIPDPFMSPEFQEIMDMLNGKTEDLEVMKLLDPFMNMPVNMDLFGYNLDKDAQENLNNFLPQLTDTSTMRDLVIGMLQKFQGFHSDPKLWRKAIRSSQDSLELKKRYDIDLDKINFNQELKKTPLALTFIEFIETIENFNPDKKQKQHSFHIAAYNALNILGLDSERKINFASSLDDAQHSFYAAHCDYFVVDDKQLRTKAKVLYKLLGIETKVYSLEEFKEEIALLRFNTKNFSISEFLNRVYFELETALILDTSSSFVYPRDYVKYKPGTLFFQYFNRIDKVQDDKDGNFLVLYKEMNNYSNFISFVEVEKLTNLLIEVFGEDKNARAKFSITDKIEVQEKRWKGRGWTNGEIDIIFEINEGSKKLSLFVFPNKTK